MRKIISLFCILITIGCKKEIKAPNFIFILSDDQGWNGTSVQMMDDLPESKSDYHETPNLEKLANRFSPASSGPGNSLIKK